VQIAVLNNLRAGRSQAKVERILALLRDYPEVQHLETERTGALPDAVAALGNNRVDLLIVNGGDGTIQHALTEILSADPFEKPPLFAPLRGGRTNMTALDLGAQRDPVKGLRTILRAVQSGTLERLLVRRPVLRIESATRGNVQYGMFFGAGVIHRAIALTHRVFPAGKSQGVLGASLVTAGLLARASFKANEGVLAPDKAQVYLDGDLVRHGEFTLLIGSTLQRLFMRLNPFWGEGSGGVRFTSMAHGADRMGRAIPGLVRGRPNRNMTSAAGYTSRNVNRAELRIDCGYTVDGEVFPGHPDERISLSADHRITFVRA
jgi:hypothetical protein